jgi:hypothetical protein
MPIEIYGDTKREIIWEAYKREIEAQRREKTRTDLGKFLDFLDDATAYFWIFAYGRKP